MVDFFLVEDDFFFFFFVLLEDDFFEDDFLVEAFLVSEDEVLPSFFFEEELDFFFLLELDFSFEALSLFSLLEEEAFLALLSNEDAFLIELFFLAVPELLPGFARQKDLTFAPSERVNPLTQEQLSLLLQAELDCPLHSCACATFVCPVINAAAESRKAHKMKKRLAK